MLIPLLLIVVIAVLIAIYRKIPTARSWEEQTDRMKADHDEAVTRSDALREETQRVRQEPEWQSVIAEKVADEAERRIRERGRAR